MWGFTQELFDNSQSVPADVPPKMLPMMGRTSARC